MKDDLLPIFRAVAEGRLTQAEALVRIKALKRQVRDPGQGVLLAGVEWTASPALASGAQPPERVLLWGVSPSAAGALQARRGGPEVIELAAPVSGAVEETFAQAMLQTFEVIRSMLGATAGTRVLLIAADAADGTVATGLEAMCRTAMEENPGFAARAVRVPADIDGAELLGVVGDESAAASPRGVAVRHVRRDGALRRELARWRVLEQGAAGEVPADAPVVFKEGGCYLITGGAGGIGLQFAREIVAQTAAARIVLTGRSTLRADTRRLLDALATPSHRIDYVELDVTRADAVDALIARLCAEGQPPSGILHCAGILRDAFVIRKSAEDFASVLSPKVAGLVNLDRAARDLPLDFMLLCSSFSACWGIVGQIDYAAANAFMDAFAAHRNRLAERGERHGRTLSVNWPLWREGGMTLDAATWQRLQDHTGMQPLATATAMRASYRGFALGCDRLLVMEGELPSMQALLEVSDSTGEVLPQQVVAAHTHAAPAGIDEALRARALEYLCRQCAQVLKVPVARLRPDAPLEQYGIDSIMAMKLVTHLESIFGRLPKTLAFEYQTITQLNQYFCDAHAERLLAILASHKPASTRGPSNNSPSNKRAVPAIAPSVPTPAASRIPGKRSLSGRETPAAQSRREAMRGEAESATALASAADAPVANGTATTGLVTNRRSANQPIAIIGLSGRYPNAWDLDAYWRNLSQGVDCIREVPAERWRWQDFYRAATAGDTIDAGQHSSKWGGFIEGADEFDPRFFSITPRDAEQIDPQERLFLQHAWMSLEDAGYTRAALQACRGGQVGVYAGVMYGEYNRSGSLASIANRVSYALNVHGPSMTLDTMCSSSLTAIHLACQDLRLGRTDMALAGGVNLSIHPGKYSMLSAGQFISSDGHCQSFGEGGDGYIPGEGVGVVVLKRLSDAERDGDAIHAIIRGSALNHGGKTNGYTVPNPQAQAAVIADALRDAGVDARQVSYIEAHGTGTKLGDPIEIAALSKAFREHTHDTGFCLIGSAKSNIGHCESAAGIAGLTKVVLQMRHRQIVPSLHSTRLNPNIDFGTTPFEVNQRLRPWLAPVIDGREVPLIAGISSFGAGGSNAHLVVEARPGHATHVPHEEDVPCVVLLSARTLPQLRQKAEDLKTFVEREVELDLHSLAYTLQIGREPMEVRLGLRADSRSELLEKLAAFLAVEDPEDGAVGDDLYYAQSRRHRESIALFRVDRDLQASVDGWFVAGKVSRLLDVWSKGLDLDWLKLHGAPLPARMHLPVYPFARERYWREEAATPSAGSAAQAMHSLVHRNASKPGRQRYLSTFRADDPRIAGLRLQGQAALPAGLQIEAARVALADALPQAAGWVLQDLCFAAPRAAVGSIELEIAVLPPGQGQRPDLERIAFELVDAGDGHVYSQGLVAPCDQASAPVIDIAAATRGALPLLADRASILDAHRAQGIDIDGLHQPTVVVHRTAEGLWLDFAVEASSSAFADCTIDPALVDASMRAAQWLLADHDLLSLPAGISSLRVYPVAARPRHASIRPHGVQQGDALCVDIDLCADDGTVCVAFTAVTLLPAVVTAAQVVDRPTTQATAIDVRATAAAPAPASTPAATEAPALPMPERRFTGQVAEKVRAIASTPFDRSPNPDLLRKPSTIALVAPGQTLEPRRGPADKPSLALALREDLAGGDSPGDIVGGASVVLREEGDGVFALRLFAAEGRIDSGLIHALQDALAFAAGLPSLKALLIESDTDVFLHGDPRVLADADGRGLLQALSAFPAPTAALVSGSALGAGFRIACACDLVVAVDDQHYGLTSDATDISALDVEEAAWLAARFGEALALQLVAEGGPRDGRSLQAAGWGASVVPRPAFAAAADALRAALSDKSADALRLLKMHLAREFDAAVAALAATDAAIDGASAAAASADGGTQADSLASRLRAVAQRLAERVPMLSARGLSASPDAVAMESAPADALAVAGELPLSSAVVRASVDADGVVLVRLEDRDARNMFSDALIAGLQEVFDRIAQSPAYKAVVLTGYDTYFASGGTRDGLKAIQEGKVRFTDHDVFHLPMRCPIPVIAAMQGHGIGAGWTLGLFCDVVLFSAESRYVSPYMNFGFTPGAGATGILPARLGFDLARDSLFTGREITGGALAQRNPQLTVLPRDQVLDRGLAIARSFACQSREDLLASKAVRVASQLAAWQALFAREVEMHATTLVGQRETLDRIEQRFASAPQAPADMPAAIRRPARTAGDILPVIRRLLAEELRVDETDIDPRTPFVELGLDSISSVAWIRRINQSFGLSIEATKVYSYPNLHKLAEHVAEQSPGDTDAAPPADTAPVGVSPTGSVTARAAASPPSTLSSTPARARVDLGGVRRTLIELLAQELRQEAESIDADRGFVELGLDSISGVTWVRAINRIYGTEIEATRVYTYPTVEQFARFVRDLLAQQDVEQPASAMSGTAPATTAIESRPADIMVLRHERPALQSWQAGDAGLPVQLTAAAQSRSLHAPEVAVIGMAGRFPMAKDLDAFWDNIANARNCISEIPPSRWDASAFYTEGQPGVGQTNSKWMGVLEGHDRFDPLFFGLSPVEAEAMDPQQRVFLECCWHGIENAGYTAERLSGSRCGVFVGCANGDYHLLSREQQIDALGFTGNATSILAARVSYFLNLQGPCVSIDTACSSSLVAIANACDSLITGASDMALAGGVYVMASADMFLKTAHAGMLSPDGRCYTFDQRANGFVPGEGVGVVMLKRLADAERDGDEILGVIRGWGVNQDGRTNGITAPNAESQQRLMRDVHARFGIDPGDIQLIEAHGTGTKLGDPIEIDGLKSAFLPATDRRQYCAIGSVKTNIGHCLTAAGISGFLKLLLSLRHRKLPPTINYETPNEHLALDDSPFFVNTTLRDWVAPAGAARQAAISSFGFSGTNAHLVLAEHVSKAATPLTTMPISAPMPAAGVIVPLSARTADQLLQKAKDLRAWIQAARPSGNTLDVVALAANLQLHRDAMDERLCFVAHSLEQVVERLAAFIDGDGMQRALPHGAFAAHVRQGRESVRLLNEDATMAELVVERCIADGNLARLCELWVKGLALDWRKLHGERRPLPLPLPPYPFADDTYWIAPSHRDEVASSAARGDRPVHRHPLLQEKVADLREQGYRQPVAGQGTSAEAASRTRRIHLPTYAFARMHCWIPSKDEVVGTASATSSPSRNGTAGGDGAPDFDAIAALFAALEEDRLSTGEVAARVRQLA